MLKEKGHEAGEHRPRICGTSVAGTGAGYCRRSPAKNRGLPSITTTFPGISALLTPALVAESPKPGGHCDGSLLHELQCLGPLQKTHQVMEAGRLPAPTSPSLFGKDAWNCRSISRRYWSCRSAITKASMSSLWAVEIKPAAAIGWSWKSRCYSSLSSSLA